MTRLLLNCGGYLRRRSPQPGKALKRRTRVLYFSTLRGGARIKGSHRIDTTPVWKPVVEALRNLGPGGRLVIYAIRKQEVDKEYLLKFDYSTHLWLEREITSVAKIARQDVGEFLEIAAKIPIKLEVQEFGLEEANKALVELKVGKIRGAKVRSQAQI
jgi:D-arabinose 1-dehydrogenase-like Zn-dependent alcohol dehydrogenase